MVYVLNNDTCSYVALEGDSFKAAQLRWILIKYAPTIQVVTDKHVDGEELDMIISSYDNQYVPVGEVPE